jgi:hypothetical protein
MTHGLYIDLDMLSLNVVDSFRSLHELFARRLSIVAQLVMLERVGK